MGPVDCAPGEAVGAPDQPHRGFETVTYVLFEGKVKVGHGNGQGEEVGGRLVADGQMAILAEGDAVRFRGVAGGGRLLLLAGVPLGEPVARSVPASVPRRDATAAPASRTATRGRSSA
jgi:redox-sensitive bicupin YhaK (pirin superfamily)